MTDSSLAASRLDTIRRIAREHEADAVLVTFLPDIRWAVGFSGSNGLLVVTQERALFCTDGRYAGQATAEVNEAEVHVVNGDLIASLSELDVLGDAGTILCQADHLTLARADQLRGEIGDRQLLPAASILDEVVAAKSDPEIAAIKGALAITEAVFESLLPLIGPGVREQELAAEIIYQHLRRGASSMSFDPIVASGVRAALPHARPTSKTIQAGELVVIDMGCFVDGYASDMTRTVAVGDPGEAARSAYEVVRHAKEKATASVRAGVSGKVLDAIARNVLDEAGLGDYFTHSLGHGVGLQIHEWPRLSYRADDVLPANAVVTVEPGVYVPERFGIRIEDMVVATAEGPNVLTQLSSELIIL